MIHAPRVIVIGGSTRKGRICPQVAEWVAGIGRASTSCAFEVIDLRDWPLPMDDEPGIPARDDYALDHTRAWSRKVSGADAVVFVTPQYNWGYPAPLKNALDHLYREWRNKPAAIVTYGSHGGGKCAAQLRQVLDGLKMRTVATMPALKLSRERVDANDGRVEPGREFAGQAEEVRRALGELADLLGAG